MVRGDVLQLLRCKAANGFVVAVGKGQVDGRASVGRRAEREPILAEADAPRVVAGAAEHLELRAIGPEAVEGLPESVSLAAYRPTEAGVADDPPDPVVESPSQVARTGVRVADAPAGEQDLAHVGLAVAVGILQEQRVGRLEDDDATVRTQQAGGDVETLGEDGELVRLAIAVGVLADRDPVAAGCGGVLGIGIVHRLGDPEPSAMVPGHADRLVDLGLRREQPGLETRGTTRCSHRFLGREGVLHPSDRVALRAPLPAR